MANSGCREWMVQIMASALRIIALARYSVGPRAQLLPVLCRARAIVTSAYKPAAKSRDTQKTPRGTVAPLGLRWSNSAVITRATFWMNLMNVRRERK